MIKKKNFISLRVYICILFLLIIGFVGVYFYCNKESNTLHTYEFTKDDLNISQDGITISIEVSKQWPDEDLHPDMPIGAQYDGILSNNGKYMFVNWNADIIFSEKTYIDSSWNGEFALNGDEVKFVAKGDPARIASKSNATFGAIMYATHIMTVKQCTINGYWLVHMSDTALFKILVLITFFWCIAIIIHFIIYIRLRQYRKRQKLDSEIIKQSINTFIGFIDAKDEYTKSHSRRVANYASEIGKRMKMSREETRSLYYITLMHDCGKIGIPDVVLKKPGRLTDEEFKIIKSHTTLGDTILVNFTAIPGIRDGAHYHHERYDGKGYPDGLKGKDIPLYARIICVADSFDAMSSNRCYRKHLDKEIILRELKENAGKQFDPEIVPYMIDMINDGFVKEVQAKYPGYESEEG